jgi:hypothetical protein
MQKMTRIYSISAVLGYETLMTLFGGKQKWQLFVNVDYYDSLEVSA